MAIVSPGTARWLRGVRLDRPEARGSRTGRGVFPPQEASGAPEQLYFSSELRPSEGHTHRRTEEAGARTAGDLAVLLVGLRPARVEDPSGIVLRLLVVPHFVPRHGDLVVEETVDGARESHG